MTSTRLTIDEMAEKWAKHADNITPLTEDQRTILRNVLGCAMSEWHFQQLLAYCQGEKQ